VSGRLQQRIPQVWLRKGGRRHVPGGSQQGGHDLAFDLVDHADPVLEELGKDGPIVPERLQQCLG
jgi:hypothetical protein